MTFPAEFVWATSSTALAREGAAPESDWAAFERSGHVPASDTGNGSTTRFPEDLALAAEHGLRAHVLTLDWTRIQPSERRVDEGELERIRELLAAARAVGVAPWLRFHDHALPGWFVDAGTFLDDKARGRWWPRFVDVCAEALGDLAAGFVTVGEPVQWAIHGFLVGDRPPGRHGDVETFGKALRGVLLAHRDAWRQLRGGGVPVALGLGLHPILAADQTMAARTNTRHLDGAVWDTPVSALRDGRLRVPGRGEEDVADLRDSGDLVLVRYRGAITVDGEGRFGPFPPDRRRSPLGDTPWPEGLGETLYRVAELLPDRPLVVEHAVAVDAAGTLEDTWRVDHLRDVLQVVEGAAGDGVPVRGFVHATGVDGYEVPGGFAAPMGLFDRDRRPRASAAFVAEVIAANTAR